MELEIIDDIKRVAYSLSLKPGDTFSRSMYWNNEGKFSRYFLYLDGKSWAYYCKKAGFEIDIRNASISDETYYGYLQKAIEDLGRFPKVSERKKYRLSFGKYRWPTLRAFVENAIAKGKVVLPAHLKIVEPHKDAKITEVTRAPIEECADQPRPHIGQRPIPPLPEKTKRKHWERTGITGFPYAPHDESGVVALFGILCAQEFIPWQILSLNSGPGIDAICWHDQECREVRVELKFILSRTSWNHPSDSIDYVVCWENRWKDFPKKVLEIKSWIKRGKIWS